MLIISTKLTCYSAIPFSHVDPLYISIQSNISGVKPSFFIYEVRPLHHDSRWLNDFRLYPSECRAQSLLRLSVRILVSKGSHMSRRLAVRIAR